MDNFEKFESEYDDLRKRASEDMGKNIGKNVDENTLFCAEQFCKVMYKCTIIMKNFSDIMEELRKTFPKDELEKWDNDEERDV